MIQMPCIVKETSAGLERLSIADTMLQQRKIWCIGEITRESAVSLILQLHHLEHEDSAAPITMYINSPGGSVPDGLAVLDTMHAMKAPITTVCVAEAASMGALLFVSGQERLMLPNACLMLHDPLTLGISGSALDVERKTKKLMKTREIIANILADATGNTPEEILAKTSVDCYFDAKEALEFGLADRIVHEI
ncbi:MAG: ATP-dependent Clp protease proteolytic subunit [Bacteroidales bacterium]|nr:ATP-dependent Clp protease proteolytic subunit [Bacteroidales bacterium]